MPAARTNGWKLGTDPILRRLRIAATIMAMVVFATLELSPDRSGDLSSLAFCFTLLVVLLGYEGLARRLPIPGTKPPDDDTEE